MAIHLQKALKPLALDEELTNFIIPQEEILTSA